MESGVSDLSGLLLFANGAHQRPQRPQAQLPVRLRTLLDRARLLILCRARTQQDRYFFRR